MSFLIQTSSDQRLFAGFPRLIAGYHVFRRLSMPRHPPCTLSSLTTFIDHRPYPGRASPYERPIMGQINTRRASNCSSPLSHRQVLPGCGTKATRARPYAKKVLDDLPAKTEKTKVTSGGLGPRHPNTSRKIAVYRDLPRRGIPTRRPLKTFC